jgi:hypothetical protein
LLSGFIPKNDHSSLQFNNIATQVSGYAVAPFSQDLALGQRKISVELNRHTLGQGI